LKQIEILCDRVAWIHYGTLKEIGDTASVVKDYRGFTKWFKAQTKKEKKHFQRQMKANQKAFDIDAYQKEVTDERQKAEPDNANVASEVKKDFYGSVISEKMSVGNRILTTAVGILFVLVCLVNVSGHSVGDVIQHPSNLVHPETVLHDANATNTVK
jgi:ABC-type polysaccharide/polyol phosphate transport system, ATPase component